MLPEPSKPPEEGQRLPRRSIQCKVHTVGRTGDAVEKLPVIWMGSRLHLVRQIGQKHGQTRAHNGLESELSCLCIADNILTIGKETRTVRGREPVEERNIRVE